MSEAPPDRRQRYWERAVFAGLLAAAIIGMIAFAVAGSDSETQLEMMREQLDTMSSRLDTMQATVRPWVSAAVTVASDLTFDAQGAHLKLRYDLSNSGRSPAFNVIAAPLLLSAAAGAPPLDPAHELQARCGDMVQLVARASRAGDLMAWDYAIFPTRSVTVQARADAARTPGIGPGAAPPTLVISCIDYRAGRTTDHHQTGDAFVLKRQAGGVLSDIDLSRHEMIPAAELRLVPAVRGSFAQ